MLTDRLPLTDIQADQVLEAYLQRFPWTDNADNKVDMLEPIQTLLGRSSKTQAAHAYYDEFDLDYPEHRLNDALQQFGKELLQQLNDTDETDEIQRLAAAIHTLSVDPADLQLGQAIDHVLKQFPKTNGPYQLEQLALAIQALPVRLTKAKAGLAVDPVLRKFFQADPNDDDSLGKLGRAIKALASNFAESQAGSAADAVFLKIGLRRNGGYSGVEALVSALAALLRSSPGSRRRRSRAKQRRRSRGRSKWMNPPNGRTRSSHSWIAPTILKKRSNWRSRSHTPQPRERLRTYCLTPSARTDPTFPRRRLARTRRWNG